MIKGIAYTAYPAKDVAKLRTWYQQTLGLSFSESFAENGVARYCETKIGDGYFSLMLHEWLDRAPGSGCGVVFEVDNIEDAIAALRGKSVTIEDPYDTPVCRVSSFEDPEGNKVTLHQITVPH